jgi:hypothetical protein
MTRITRTNEQKLLDRARAQIDKMVWLTYDFVGEGDIFSGVSPNEVYAFLDDIGIVRRWFDELSQHAASITEAA